MNPHDGAAARIGADRKVIRGAWPLTALVLTTAVLPRAILRADDLPARPATRELRVEDLPPGRGFPAFYRKHVDVRGLPVLSSEKPSDYALLEAAYLIDRMLTGRADILDALVKNQVRFVVMAYSERTTDVPEQRDMKPKDFWDVRARGLGASRAIPIVSCGEENLLGYNGDPYHGENILIHEFAHAIQNLGLRDVDPTFDLRLRKAYAAAREKGLWKGTYARSDVDEYWAEAVQSWFDCNLAPPNFQHNEINDRDKLKAYDPEIAALIAEVFGDRPWRYVPPERRQADGRAHLMGYDPDRAPTFSWGNARKKYEEVVAEKRRTRKQGQPLPPRGEEDPR